MNKPCLISTMLDRRCLLFAIIIMSLTTTPSRGECNSDEDCVDKDRCSVFLDNIDNYKTLTGMERKDERKRLRDKVCKKKPQKVCCSKDSCSDNSQSYPKSFLPAKDQCGVSCIGSKLVVFGEDAVLGEFPWVALVGSYQIKNAWDNVKKKRVKRTFPVYHCGGTLINTWYVLTAAHCHTDKEKIEEVVLGEWDVQTNPDCAGENDNCDNPKVQRKEVEDVIIHRDYIKADIGNDIALVKMRTEVVLNRFVQLACLPIAKYFMFYTQSQIATVVGWGRSSNSNDQEIILTRGVATRRLQKGRVPIQPLSQCKAAYSQSNISISNMCAGGGKENTGSCKGDSGGGLFADSGEFLGQSQGNVHVLVGMVSFGKRLCGDDPGVYTKVDQFLPWIKFNIEVKKDK